MEKNFDWLGAPGTRTSRERATEDSEQGSRDVPQEIPGVGSERTRRRRNRAKDPGALRNDPDRVMAGAYIKKGVHRRVKQALADPDVGEGTNYSLLVDALLERWLKEVGYPSEKA